MNFSSEIIHSPGEFSNSKERIISSVFVPFSLLAFFHLSTTFENKPDSEFKSVCENMLFWFLNRHCLEKNKKCAIFKSVQRMLNGITFALYVLGILPCTLHILFHLTCVAVLRGRYYYYPHFLDYFLFRFLNNRNHFSNHEIQA